MTHNGNNKERLKEELKTLIKDTMDRLEEVQLEQEFTNLLMLITVDFLQELFYKSKDPKLRSDISIHVQLLAICNEMPLDKKKEIMSEIREKYVKNNSSKDS